MGSDVHACACGWDPFYGASSGVVPSFGSSARIGTGYLSGDLVKREDRAGARLAVDPG
jgi:hypothetical protein